MSQKSENLKKVRAVQAQKTEVVRSDVERRAFRDGVRLATSVVAEFKDEVKKARASAKLTKHA